MINGNKQNLEPGEEPDIKDSGINGKNQINENNSNNNENDIKANNDDENNNIDQNLNFEAKKENVEEKEIGEIDEINDVLPENIKKNENLCKIVISLSSDEMNILNNSGNEIDNILSNLEKSFNCCISKIVKIIDDKEMNLITFNGTPKQNALAIYQLQKYLLNDKIENNDQNEAVN